MKKRIIQKIVLGAVVMHRDKMLLLQRNKDEKVLPGLWELPSGKREELEEPIAALKREILEETGLKINVISIINLFTYTIKKPDCISDSIQINFLAEPVGNSKVILSHEHENFAWVNRKTLKKYPVTKEVRDAIKTAWHIKKRR